MKATELIGKVVTRTNHCTYIHGQIDRSYMGSRIIILNAEDNLISYQNLDSIFKDDKISLLSGEWCDDNWMDIEDFLSDSEKALAEFKEAERFKTLK